MAAPNPLLNLIVVSLIYMPSTCSIGQTHPPAGETSASKDGVHLRLSVEKLEYRRNERVRIKASAENLSRTPVVCWIGSLMQSPIYLFVDSRRFGTHPIEVKSPDESRNMPPAEGYVTIEPGQNVIREILWDQAVSTRTGTLHLPAGEYSVEAVLHIGRYDSEKRKPDPLRVSIRIRVQ